MDSICYPAKIRRLGENLMHHQCWFFGRDILHADENLLIRYGFERYGVPEDEKGGNAYRLSQSEQREIVLWGFGLFFGEKPCGGVFIRRYGFSPNFLTVGNLKLPIYKSEQLPLSQKPPSISEQKTVSRLTCAAIDWITEYEIWIEETCGKHWRKDCLQEWSNAALSPRQIKNGWKRLRKNLENI